MDLLYRYSGRVAGIARTNVVEVQHQLHATLRKTASENAWKFFRTIQSFDLWLWTFQVGTVVLLVELHDRTASAWSTKSTLLHLKQPPETPEKNIRAFQRSDL